LIRLANFKVTVLTFFVFKVLLIKEKVILKLLERLYLITRALVLLRHWRIYIEVLSHSSCKNVNIFLEMKVKLSRFYILLLFVKVELKGLLAVSFQVEACVGLMVKGSECVFA